MAVANCLNNIGQLSISAVTGAYTIKKMSDNNKLRSYYYSPSYKTSIENVGSKEYKDVVERRKNN